MAVFVRLSWTVTLNGAGRETATQTDPKVERDLPVGRRQFMECVVVVAWPARLVGLQILPFLGAGAVVSTASIALPFGHALRPFTGSFSLAFYGHLASCSDHTANAGLFSISRVSQLAPAGQGRHAVTPSLSSAVVLPLPLLLCRRRWAAGLVVQPLFTRCYPTRFTDPWQCHPALSS